MNTYFIVYLQKRSSEGYYSVDKSTICVAQGQSYEEDEYDLASRKKFSNREEAIEYAKNLAKEHNKDYEPFDKEDHSFLD